MAKRRYRSIAPAAVIGFGGYPALPALLAAQSMGIATLIHEQNAVLGRVNRLVAGKVDAIATAYPEVDRLKPAYRAKTRLVGNPVRDQVLALRSQPFPQPAEDGPFRMLVTGGSQGATILSTIVPQGLSLLPEEFRSRLRVTQQCRAEDIDRVRSAYAEFGIKAELATYLADLPALLGEAHLFISRAGASSIAELTAAGRPAILIPLPSAMDDHQTANARELVAAGGARMIAQSQFTPERLAGEIEDFASDPGRLAEAAAHARAVGHPDAARELADLVERVGRTPGADALAEHASDSQPIPNGAMA
jgi:UDP-N-acetylglucosamine--N-acetylmuramyl-(pentapeptide) pyrophosphoryl-undecaprenol N-acetylglucosamine transferase